MERVELMIIKDTFQIEGFGIVVLPNLAFPKEGWRESMETVVIVKPDGGQFETAAWFGITHFSVSDSKATINDRYRVTISFPERTKKDLPIGSRVLVSETIKNAFTAEG
jgi:hypothetical protein